MSKQQHHSYAAQKNNKPHHPNKKKNKKTRQNKDKKGGDLQQPVGSRYTSIKVDKKNENTFKEPRPAREEVGVFRDGCYVSSEGTSGRPANCIELGRPKLKSKEKELKIRDFKDGYFELRSEGDTSSSSKSKTPTSKSLPGLLTPDHFRSQSQALKVTTTTTTTNNTVSLSSPPTQQVPTLPQQLTTSLPHLPHVPQQPVYHHQPMQQLYPFPVPHSMPLHIHPQQHPQQQQQQRHVPSVTSLRQPMPMFIPTSTQNHLPVQQSQSQPPQQLPFSFQNLVQGCGAPSAPFQPPTGKVFHVEQLTKSVKKQTAPVNIPVLASNINSARSRSPKRSVSPPVTHEKWAGGGYSNSPHPSMLAAPVF